jgi:cytochrome P450
MASCAPYFSDLIPERRQTPRDDLLSLLIAAEEQGDRLSEGELLITCILLFVAGHETTVNLIGNGLLALLNHPDELAKLRADLTLLPSAVEELLRYDSPCNGPGASPTLTSSSTSQDRERFPGGHRDRCGEPRPCALSRS